MTPAIVAPTAVSTDVGGSEARLATSRRAGPRQEQRHAAGRGAGDEHDPYGWPSGKERREVTLEFRINALSQ
jgi:hypothetical protein